jgi:hypothetical protein
MEHTTYLLCWEDGTVYVGCTGDLKIRLGVHRSQNRYWRDAGPPESVRVLGHGGLEEEAGWIRWFWNRDPDHLLNKMGRVEPRPARPARPVSTPEEDEAELDWVRRELLARLQNLESSPDG